MARAQSRGYALEAAGAALTAHKSEGNLLAAAQELRKLELLAPERTLDLALVQSAIVCSAKFDVFQVAQAAAGGDAARALHILQCLQSLREDGTEPVLTLWTLVREIRGLWQSKEQARLRSSARSGWNLAATPAVAATRRIGQLPLAALLESAGQVDTHRQRPRKRRFLVRPHRADPHPRRRAALFDAEAQGLAGSRFGPRPPRRRSVRRYS